MCKTANRPKKIKKTRQLHKMENTATDEKHSFRVFGLYYSFAFVKNKKTIIPPFGGPFKIGGPVRPPNSPSAKAGHGSENSDNLYMHCILCSPL